MSFDKQQEQLRTVVAAKPKVATLPAHPIAVQHPVYTPPVEHRAPVHAPTMTVVTPKPVEVKPTTPLKPAPVYHTMTPAPLYHTMAPKPVYHTMTPAPVYHTMAPKPFYHTMTPAPVYHTMTPAPVYHTMAPKPFYHTTAPAPVYHTMAPKPAAQPSSKPQSTKGPRDTPTPPSVTP